MSDHRVRECCTLGDRQAGRPRLANTNGKQKYFTTSDVTRFSANANREKARLLAAVVINPSDKPSRHGARLPLRDFGGRI
ncbi:MAG: hypothetical protein ACRELG_02155, partial [Gemmataceae bacterium]